jgi:hypothetical protein
MAIIITRLLLPRNVSIDLRRYLVVKLENIRIQQKIEYMSKLDSEICRIEYKPESLNIKVYYAEDLPQDVIEVVDENAYLLIDKLPDMVRLHRDPTAYVEIGEEEVRILVYSDVTGGAYESCDIREAIDCIVERARARMFRYRSE